MTKVRKYIFPIILIKVLLVFLVLQLFFTSCSKDDMYCGDLYSEGPVFELQSSFGGTKKVFEIGDTVYLEIHIHDSVLRDEILKEYMPVTNATFNVRFAIKDKEGNMVFPKTILKSGQSINKEENYFYGQFNVSDTLPSCYKLGFVFDEPGDYSFYYINTPNQFCADGGIDITTSNDISAYAVYLFEDGSKTIEYAKDENQVKIDILDQAGFDQSIKDFTIFDSEEE